MTQPHQDPTGELAAAHARFARASLGIYLGAAFVALAMVVTFLVTELSHGKQQILGSMLIEVDEREHYLARHLSLLVQELQRLGLRSEVDLLDQNLAPEKSLLRLSHQGSTFFNVGVAIVDEAGSVAWAEPQTFLPVGKSFANEPWLMTVRRTGHLLIVPVDPERDDAILYVVSPVIRNQRFVGTLIGAMDLAHGDELTVDKDPNVPIRTVLATRTGKIVYPPRPPVFAAEPSWTQLFADPSSAPTISTIDLASTPTVVAASPVAGTDLLLLLLADEKPLFATSYSRMWWRLGLAVGLAFLPLFALVFLLRRSLRVFRNAEEHALRESRLRLVGEAANLIAHEVKNALNGIRMGVELGFQDTPASSTRRERALTELRSEIERLSNFTSELMTFSRGIAPKRVDLNLCDFIAKIIRLGERIAEDSGAVLEISLPETPLHANADPQLLHVVVWNLLTNAIEAAATATGSPPKVDVRLSANDTEIKLSVSDNGPGVSAEILPRLFEPFQSGKANGVGIGLALSKRIALAHHGDLVLTPSPTGATFTLTLPRGSYET